MQNEIAIIPAQNIDRVKWDGCINDSSNAIIYATSASTYDREGKNDDGFSGKYSFIRRNADSTLVMFEAKGPGVINRIWTPTPTDDTLDIYVDDTVFSIKYHDLFSGKIKPFTEPLCGNALGGFYCYYPILFEDSCKIISRGKKLQFHQLQWRSYAKGTIVKSDFKPIASKETSSTDGEQFKKINVTTNLPFAFLQETIHHQRL